MAIPKIKGLRTIAAISMVCMSALLAACGGGGGSDSGTTTGASTTPAAGGSAGSSSSSSPGALTSVAGAIPSGSNVLPVSVNGGATGITNIALASAKICVPGSTTNCVTINNMIVDTGSVGIRVTAAALGSALSLPAVNNAGGNPAAECAPFSNFNVWGAIRSADVMLGGETAHSLPIQVLNDASTPTIPSDCAAPTDATTVIHANGIIGVGYNPQDCGVTCAATAQRYYVCTSATTCGHSQLTYASQVSNPVAAFATDNNGLIFELPAIPLAGASSVSGAVVFGIGTQSNNSPNGLSVLPVNTQNGVLTATMNGFAYQQSIVDSGTTYITFNDSSIPTCANGDFCPTTTKIISTTLQGTSGAAVPVSFSVVNASTQAAGYANNVALSSTSTTRVSLGLPFFYGKTIAFGLNGANTSLGTGPFVAF